MTMTKKLTCFPKYPKGKNRLLFVDLWDNLLELSL